MPTGQSHWQVHGLKIPQPQSVRKFSQLRDGLDEGVSDGDSEGDSEGLDDDEWHLAKWNQIVLNTNEHMLTSQKVENSETLKVGPMVGKKDYTRKIQDERWAQDGHNRALWALKDATAMRSTHLSDGWLDGDSEGYSVHDKQNVC